MVGIGRGLKAREDVALIEALAEAAGAELACSRPLAEGVDWLAKERYIGISGQHIAPELYFAIGISGQLQHMVGVRGAETIVAINSDKNAPVFAQCDYGVVGDLYQLVPALTAALNDGRMPETAEPDFDVIVVGAGAAGCVTALPARPAGPLGPADRAGRVAGSKNLSGGVLYGRGSTRSSRVSRRGASRAPHHAQLRQTSSTPTSSVAIDYAGTRWPTRSTPSRCCAPSSTRGWPSVPRRPASFVMPGVRVDACSPRTAPPARRVVGVRAGDDELRARVVVAADGVNSFLAQEVGLRPKPPQNHLAVGVKAVVSLPRETIEERFA